MRVLIIDDSLTMRSILKRIMSELGFETKQAQNGSEGLVYLKDNLDCDLVLVDWNMPVMNGLDFLKTVRSDIAFEELIIIMVTTEVELLRMMEALHAGANEYIMKPFTKEDLTEKLKIVGLLRE